MVSFENIAWELAHSIKLCGEYIDRSTHTHTQIDDRKIDRQTDRQTEREKERERERES
jgi:hypothetical protein